jgi:hypothetical protein
MDKIIYASIGLITLFMGNYYYKIYKESPFKLIIKGKRLCILSIVPKFGINIISWYHTYNGIKLNNQDYNDKILTDGTYVCDNLVICKHTINDDFCYNSPVISIKLNYEKYKNDSSVIFSSDNFNIIINSINKSQLKTHIKYNTFFSTKEITLDWSKDAQFIYDIRF